MPNRPLRCVIYIRVSTKEQLEGHSLDAQRDLCTQFATARGWHVVALFEGEGESAKNDRRKSFQKALTFIRAGNADVFLTHKVDRFARNLIDALSYLHELQKLNVTYCAVAEQFDFTTPQGWLMLVMLAALAELFLKNLSLETKKGKGKRAEKGYWNGDLSWGYRVSADGKTAEPDPATAPGLQLAFSQFLTGLYSDLDIARQLNDKGYRTSNDSPFSKDTVRSMLQNKFYIGLVTYKGAPYPGTHPPLISEPDFNHAQEIRRARRSLPRSPNHGARVYPLSRLCVCATCLRTLRGQTLGRDLTTRYYRDPDRDYGGHCPSPRFLNAQRLETHVASIFSHLQLPADWQARSLHHLTAGRDPNADARKRERLQEKIKRLGELYAEGIYTRPEYDRKYADARSELDTLKPTPAIDLTQAAALLADFPHLWAAASPENQKRLLQAMLERVVVNGPDVIAIQPKPNFYSLLVYCGPDGIRIPRRLIQLLAPATPLARLPYVLSSSSA